MKPPVLTLTLNPALDHTVTLPTLDVGRVNVANASTLGAGGKGVNVASVLADWGVPVVASGLLGRDNAAPFEALFAAKGIDDAFLRLPGATRTNIKLVTLAPHDTTDVNLPGMDVAPAALEALLQQLCPGLLPGQTVVVAGSLPQGLADTGYTPLLAALSDAGAHVVLDTSGRALEQTLAQGPLPALVKPNRHELEAWAGRALPTTADLVDAARTLLHRGVATVVVSLGSDGALLCRNDGCWQAQALPVTPHSTVGAGDAMVAGLVAARHEGLPWPQALARGCAFAAAKLQRLGPHLPPRDEVLALEQAVRVHAVVA